MRKRWHLWVWAGVNILFIGPIAAMFFTGIPNGTWVPLAVIPVVYLIAVCNVHRCYHTFLTKQHFLSRSLLSLVWFYLSVCLYALMIIIALSISQHAFAWGKLLDGLTLMLIFSVISIVMWFPVYLINLIAMFIYCSESAQK